MAADPLKMTPTRCTRLDSNVETLIQIKLAGAKPIGFTQHVNFKSAVHFEDFKFNIQTRYLKRSPMDPDYCINRVVYKEKKGAEAIEITDDNFEEIREYILNLNCKILLSVCNMTITYIYIC